MKTDLFEGERVRLTAFTDDDVPQFAMWLSDLGLQRLVNPGLVAPLNVQDLLDPNGWLAADRTSEENTLLAVRTKTSNSFIGITALVTLDAIARTAEIGINIADADYRGQGYGTEVMTLAMRYGFSQLNLNRIELHVFSYNEPGIRLYYRLGFQLEATEREALYRDGVYYDLLYMGILKNEWEATHAAR